jgi:ElaB/YqjD/DUF883 family membrane-anchored ribosome-binding protein
MDPQPDVIREQIEETRSHLTEKLETLEAEVKGTVQTAKETVEGTISSVKETVHNAKETVKRTFDPSYQVDHHPWVMLGLAAVTGVVAGALLSGRQNYDRRMVRRLSEVSDEPYRGDGREPSFEAPRRPGFMDRLTGQLGNEVDKAKDLAISTLVGVVGDVIRKSIPALGTAVENMLTQAAAEYGLPQQHGEEPRRPATGSPYQAPPMY